MMKIYRWFLNQIKLLLNNIKKDYNSYSTRKINLYQLNLKSIINLQQQRCYSTSNPLDSNSDINNNKPIIFEDADTQKLEILEAGKKKVEFICE